MTTNLHLRALVSLGMTPIEAAVYACLLQHPASTGYRISREVDKPTANTYKALASLEERGAVTVAGDGSRLYSAVPPDEFLASLDRRFRRHRSEAARGLAGLQTAPRADGIQHVRTRDQVVTRLRTMLGRCRSAALLDLAPAVLESVAEDLAALADTGAEVMVKAYREVEIEGVEVVLSRDGHADTMPVAAVVDGREVLLAAIDSGSPRVRRGMWSVQADVAVAAHRALVAELLFAEMEHGLATGISIDEIEDTFAVYQRLRALAGGAGEAG